VISAGPITIDPEKREARVHGDRLILTDDEFDLLAALAREPHREWTPTELVDHFLVKYPDPGWILWDLKQLAAKISRVGIEHDLARADGLFRLFKPEQGGE
jgi:hypothetical protein